MLQLGLERIAHSFLYKEVMGGEASVRLKLGALLLRCIGVGGTTEFQSGKGKRPSIPFRGVLVRLKTKKPNKRYIPERNVHSSSFFSKSRQ
ncbi:hypothetical protein TNCV_3878741 [Trichonephila clavipes]|nr:hypothetical protein TNCV_3878741 [Trichonephila clavipes]